MLKRIFACLLAACLIFSMVACEADPETPDNTKGNSVSVNPQETDKKGELAPTTTAEPFDPETWGVQEYMTADNNEAFQKWQVKLPAIMGASSAAGKVAEQADETVVILGGTWMDSPKVGSVAEVFPAYNERLLERIADWYSLLAEDIAVSMNSSETVKVGERNMQIFRGVISFVDDGVPRSFPYVTYVVELKTAGMYGYWMVYDISPDQSKGQLIEEHAYHIAQTFRE